MGIKLLKTFYYTLFICTDPSSTQFEQNVDVIIVLEEPKEADDVLVSDAAVNGYLLRHLDLETH